jgi:hypothetical protein
MNRAAFLKEDRLQDSNIDIDKWKSKCGGADMPELKRLKELRLENDRLKRMNADLAPENAMISCKFQYTALDNFAHSIRYSLLFTN